MSVFIFIFILFFLSLSLSWTFFSLVFWAVFPLPFRTDATQLVALVVRILRVLVESPPPAHTHTHVQQIRQLSLNGDAWKDFSLWALNFFSISLLFCVHERLTVCIFDVCKRTKCENARGDFLLPFSMLIFSRTSHGNVSYNTHTNADVGRWVWSVCCTVFLVYFDLVFFLLFFVG